MINPLKNSTINSPKLFEPFSYKSSVIWGLIIKNPKHLNYYLIWGWVWFKHVLFVLAGREVKASYGLRRKRNLFVNVCLHTSIVYMYMKRGFLEYAVRVVEEVSDKDTRKLICKCFKNWTNHRTGKARGSQFNGWITVQSLLNWLN